MSAEVRARSQPMPSRAEKWTKSIHQAVSAEVRTRSQTMPRRDDEWAQPIHQEVNL